MKKKSYTFSTQQSYSLILLLLFTVACKESTKPSPEVDQASELQKVIEHYEKNDVDKLKKDAALYLIENLQYHEANYSENSYMEVFEKIGNSETDKERNLYQDEFKDFDHEEVELKSDQEVITAEFLINNIDLSFKAWRTYPWCKNISFEDFKLYILPFRVSNEPLEDCRAGFQKKYEWLVDSMKNSFDMGKAFTLIYNNFYSEYSSTGTSKYPIPMSYTQFMAAKRGPCEDACNALGMALRSMGIKCAFDYSVQWGNQKPTTHSWISYPQDNSVTYYIDKNKKLEVPKHIHSAKFTVDDPGATYLVDSMTPQYYKRGTKVRRLTFHKNRDNLILIKDLKQVIRGNWNDICSVDITNKYIKVANIQLGTDNQFLKDNIVYLSVFNEKIVDVAEIKNGIAAFPNVGVQNIYFPMIHHASQLRPIFKPFLLGQDGKMKFFLAEQGKKQNIVITRKYPVLANTLNNANFLFHGRFQGANQADFRDARDLFKIEGTYLFPTQITIKKSPKFRYLRFLPEESRKLSIAELAFYSSNKGKQEKIKGRVIADFGEASEGNETAFDNDFTTICHKDEGAWIGLDLGNGHEKSITKIMFCPRGDSNFIIPGNEYELFYWDNGWVSFEKKKAVDYKLLFNNVPKGALFWLTCITGGLEERPFTYENGRQIWW